MYKIFFHKTYINLDFTLLSFHYAFLSAFDEFFMWIYQVFKFFKTQLSFSFPYLKMIPRCYQDVSLLKQYCSAHLNFTKKELIEKSIDKALFKVKTHTQEVSNLCTTTSQSNITSQFLKFWRKKCDRVETEHSMILYNPMKVMCYKL